MALIALGLGFVVGISLALTGSGGTAFAVPLLVYVLNMSPHRAVCASMAAIGVTTALATVRRLGSKERALDLRSGLLLAIGGIVGAPAGAWLGGLISERWLLVLFAGVVLVVAVRMLFGGPQGSKKSDRDKPSVESGGALRLSDSRIFAVLGAGIITGVLAGLVGVGGGFLLVPVLVLIGGLEMHGAIATSQYVIAVISIAATASHLIAGQRIPLGPASLFAVGSIVGMAAGAPLAAKISGARLQRLFGVALLVMALVILLKNLR